MTKTAGKKKRCKHNWTQIGKTIYITEDGMPAKKLIDQCVNCMKQRER